MAQAKTRGSKKSSSASARSRTRKPQSSSRTSSTKSNKQRSTKSTKQNSSPTSRLRDVPQAVEKTGKKVGHDVGKVAGKAGHDVGKVASKARTPLLASGAALAGAAGGLAIGAMRSRHSHRALAPKARQQLKHVKISSQDIAKAARGIGTVSQHVADLTSEMNGEHRQKNGNGRRRSPVEVVLEGLTTRR